MSQDGLDGDEANDDRSPARGRKRLATTVRVGRDGHAEEPYIGMNISTSGLFVAKPDVFEQLLKGRKVLARVRDEAGTVTTKELARPCSPNHSSHASDSWRPHTGSRWSRCKT